MVGGWVVVVVVVVEKDVWDFWNFFKNKPVPFFFCVGCFSCKVGELTLFFFDIFLYVLVNVVRAHGVVWNTTIMWWSCVVL